MNIDKCFNIKMNNGIQEDEFAYTQWQKNEDICGFERIYARAYALTK